MSTTAKQTDEAEFVKLLRVEYLDEASFLLEQAEASLLAADNESVRADELGKLFRTMHTVKGSGAAVGFRELVDFAHALEDALTTLRAAPKLLTSEVTSVLLKGVDALRRRVSSLRKGAVAPWNVEELSKEVRAVSAGLEAGKRAIAAESASFGFFDEEPQGSASPKQMALANASQRDDIPVLKVDARRIDGFMDTVGELMVAKSQLLDRVGSYSGDQGLNAVAALLDSIVRELQDKALSLRMTPLKSLFLKLQRQVRDLALAMKKPITFTMMGEDTELDRAMVDALADPLMHMIRNCVDHGIESAENRVAAGKAPQGHVRIAARQAAGRVVIDVIDDGGGVRREAVVKKAVSAGLIKVEDGARLSDRDAIRLIFHPGLSTAEKITDVSGRGVGMDVVKSNVDRLKGTIEIESRPGHGTTISLSLPLTTSITDGILMTLAGQPLVVPIDLVQDLVPAERLQPYGPTGFVVEVRGSILPVIDLFEVVSAARGDLPTRRRNQGRGMLVVVESEGRRVALAVESVLGQMQLVLKPLGSILREVPGVAGAAILGDGRVALVLDLPTLLKTTNEQRGVA